MPNEALLQVSDLTIDFPAGRRGAFRALSGVNLTVEAGQTVGVVGESGSGKTTIGRAILGLVPPTSGRILFDGQDIAARDRRTRRRRAGDVTSVFQDPYSSLNPALRVSASLLESTTHARISRADAQARMVELLGRVGLPAHFADRYPGALSGGQRQRLAIARALMSSPRLVVCDEAVSALDVSVQAQVLNLLRELQAGSALSYLFIGHDLDVVRYMSDRIVVLYRGSVMEEGPAEVVARRPGHPYTQALVAATPEVRRNARRSAAVQARPPERSTVAPPANGCPFAPRCPLVIERCWTERPLPEPVAGGGVVACHRRNDAATNGAELMAQRTPLASTE